MSLRRRTARFGVWLAVAAALAVGGFVSARVPTDYFVVTPGVTRPLSDLVTVPDGKKDARGRFLLVTVSAQPANSLLYVMGRLNPQADLEPKEKILGPDRDLRRYQEETRRMMAESQGNAKVAAFRALGFPARVVGTGARITTVLPGGPAEGRLQIGDVVVALDGQPVAFADELVERLQQAPVGARVTLRVRRGGGPPFDVSLTTVEHPERPGRAAIRVGVANAPVEFEIPRPVQIEAEEITGPSAGLMFALEIIDQLSPEDLTRGRVIAGTGTITPDGKVGAVGGVRQKAIAAERAGATIFLAPREDAPRLLRAAGRMRVIPVGTLQEALEALRKE